MTRNEKLNRKAIEYSLAIKDFMVMHGAKEESAKTIAKMMQLVYMTGAAEADVNPIKEIDNVLLEKQGEKPEDEAHLNKDEEKPNGGIVLEDFNEGDGFYKINLAYLSKEQVEEIESLVIKWNKKVTDETIKNCIGICLTDVSERRFRDYNTSLKECLAWLEKQGKQKFVDDLTQQDAMDIAVAKCFEQGEQKPADTRNEMKAGDSLSVVNGTPFDYEHATITQKDFAPKFKVGYWVIDKQGITHQIANVIENVTNYTYGYDIVGGGYFNDKTEGVRLWTIQDAKEGDVLVASDGSLFIFAKVKDNSAYYHFSLCKNGSQEISDGNHAWETANSCHPATEEQCELLFQKMKDSGYEWDAEKKEVRKIEQKSKWTEEDGCYMGECISAISTKDGWSFEEKRKTKHWLQSLKQRMEGEK